MNLYRLLFGQLMEGAGDGTDGGAGGGGSGGAGNGAAAAGSGAAGAGGAADAGASGGGGKGGDGGAADWRATLPEDIRAEKSLADIKDVPALAKTYVEAQKLIGRSIRIPGKDAGKADLDAFQGKLKEVPGVVILPDSADEAAMGDLFTKLGRPESPDKYKLTNPEKLPEGVVINEARVKAIREAAFKLGLSQKQLDGIYQVYNADVIQQAEARNAEVKAGQTALRAEWGAGFDQRMAAASALLKQFGSAELAAELTPAALVAWPELAKVLSAAGMHFLEDGVISGDKGGLVPSVSELREKVAEIMNNKDHAYHDRKKPGHQEAVARVDGYHQQIALAEKAARG